MLGQVERPTGSALIQPTGTALPGICRLSLLFRLFESMEAGRYSQERPL